MNLFNVFQQQRGLNTLPSFNPSQPMTRPTGNLPQPLKRNFSPQTDMAQGISDLFNLFNPQATTTSPSLTPNITLPTIPPSSNSNNTTSSSTPQTQTQQPTDVTGLITSLVSGALGSAQPTPSSSNAPATSSVPVIPQPTSTPAPVVPQPTQTVVNQSTPTGALGSSTQPAAPDPLESLATKLSTMTNVTGVPNLDAASMLNYLHNLTPAQLTNIQNIALTGGQAPMVSNTTNAAGLATNNYTALGLQTPAPPPVIPQTSDVTGKTVPSVAPQSAAQVGFTPSIGTVANFTPIPQFNASNVYGGVAPLRWNGFGYF